MNEYVAGLIREYRRKGLLLDTVLFVLLAVGTYNRRLIGNDKRLKAYIPQDLDTLVAFIKLFDQVITTPNIATEVSNLTGHLWDTDFPQEFARYVDPMDEHYLPSKLAIKSEVFEGFGLTDATISLVAKGRYLVLTDDLRLVRYLEGQQVDVINFNHIRTLNW